MEPSDNLWKAVCGAIIGSGIGAIIGTCFCQDTSNDCMGFIGLGNAFIVVAFGLGGCTLGIPSCFAVSAISNHLRELAYLLNEGVTGRCSNANQRQLLRAVEWTPNNEHLLLRPACHASFDEPHILVRTVNTHKDLN